jgi:hypothetical protein
VETEKQKSVEESRRIESALKEERDEKSKLKEEIKRLKEGMGKMQEVMRVEVERVREEARM